VRYSEIRSLSHDQALAARAEALRDAHKIIDTAEAEKRGLTSGEKRRINDFESTVTAIDDHVRFNTGGLHGAVSRAAADMNGAGEKRTLGAWAAEEFRALGEGSGSGSYLVPDQYLMSGVWDRLAAASVGLASGFTVIDTVRDQLHIPKVTADGGAAAWTAEGATITPGDPTLNEVIATPRKLAGLIQVSNETLADSNPALLDGGVFSPLLRNLALKLDLGFFEGVGTPPEIRGLKNVASIQTASMGVNGAAFTNLDPFADAIGLLAQANANATAIVMHPRSWQSLSKLKEQTASNNKPLLQESAGSAGQGIERRIYGVPVYLSSQLSITETQGTSGAVCSSAYVYEASEVIAVRRQEARIEVDSSRLFNSDQSEVRGVLRFDVQVPNPTAVCRILGIL
jgi:HK97 family phage major capsid protein